MANSKRRQVVVDARLQVGMVSRMVGWLYLYFLGFALLANTPAVLDLLTEDASTAAHAAAVERLSWFAKFVLAPMGLTFCAMVVHGVFLTHRLAGPVYRLKQVLRGLARRDFTQRAQLREGDHLQDVAADLRNAIAALADDSLRMRRMNAETRDALRWALDAVPKHERALRARIHTALDSTDRLDAHLAAAVDGEVDAEREVRVPLEALTAEAQDAAHSGMGPAPASSPSPESVEADSARDLVRTDTGS